VGVTEAGDGEDGRIKSAIGIGSLLADGIGDTIRVSLTEDPVKEVPVAAALARAAEARWALPPVRVADPGAPWVEDPFDHRRRATRSVRVGPFALGGEQPVRVELDLGVLPADPGALARSLREALAPLPELACEGWLVEIHDPESFARLPELARALAGAGLDAPLSVRTEAAWLAAVPQPRGFARAVVTVGALVSDEQLAGAAGVAARQGLPLEWELRGRIPELAGLLDRALAASPGVADLLVSVDAELPVHAARLAAARLRARGAADVPIVLRHRRHPADTDEDSLLPAAVALGAPLADGIGDAVALAGFPHAGRALDLAYRILQGARLRTTRTEFISCPSCGRTLFDLETTTARIKARTQHLSGVKIAIMGCIVNGPGEMADADFGYVGSGPGSVNLYVGKQLVERHVPQAEADDRLVALIREHGRWVDPA
jgi:(E)-4-hydroxy-3-methylbut-2-enyl-diphosphate synthase